MAKFRKITALLCAAVLLAAVGIPRAGAFGGTVISNPGLSMTVDGQGQLQITRSRTGSSPMGRDGTWTVFVYMCGSDLESGSGMATRDLQEMLQASTGSSVRFVVQTGGSRTWKNTTVSASRLERYVISGGRMALADAQPGASMGSGRTLADFLQWGVGNYPAAKMGLVFWDHGSGCINGVCFDERYSDDSLSLSEIHAALGEVSQSMTDRFEFIGFDACLMSTVECANILASYARYLYGSEEVEPGYGWNYTTLGNALGKDPKTDGAALGKVVCDSFYAMCAQVGRSSSATFAVTDLSRIDEVVTAFHSFAQSLYDATEDAAVLADVVRSVKAADNYGGNNRSEGYTNMVDLAGIVRAGSKYASGAQEVLSAIDRAVIYKKNGSNHSAACGLSTYYPLSVQGSAELKVFGEVAVSPSYLSFVDRSAYGFSNEGATQSYSADTVQSLWDLIWGTDSVWDWFDTQQSWEQSGCGTYWDSYDLDITGSSSLIQFYDGPRLLPDGRYGFSLTSASLPYAASVQGIVYMLSDDGEDLIELGFTADVDADWERGVFLDNFDGCWFSLPDGQNIAVYLVDECYGYDIYTSPILLNGQQTNLRLTHSYLWSDRVVIDGVWDGIDENGMAARDVTSLQTGDVITPLFCASPLESDEEFLYYGDEYRFRGDPEICFATLWDGDYFYGFCIDDIYGDYRITPFESFVMEDGEVYFYED